MKISEKNLKIAFLYPKRYSFYPLDYLERGLGGSETALVLLSKALAKRGHQVEVYNSCYKNGIYDGVKWQNIWEFSKTDKFDVIVSVRLLETFDIQPLNARIRALWIQDESIPEITPYLEDKKINLIISSSETQYNSLKKSQQINEGSWFKSRNAFDECIYNQELAEKVKTPGQLIYCSAPDRGLDYLLKIWPKITKSSPDVTLVVTGSFALWGSSDEENDRIFADIYHKLSRFENVKLYKRLPKRRLAELQAASIAMIYPTNFNEMFCISALECMSVGTPLITTKKAALTERLVDGHEGFLIDEIYGSSEYEKTFISKVTHFLENPNLQAKFSNNSYLRTRNMGYDSLAEEWEQEFIKRLI